MFTPRLAMLSVLVLVLSAITFSEGLRMSSGPEKCCFTFAERQIPRGRVVGYTKTSQQCSNQAVMFKTQKGRQVCARPSDRWVKDYINILDGKDFGKQTPLL
uniref:C-C motif chemokine n=1 Tax=Oncorhynchus mykiss TaxID=8022 RepID=C1BHV3_ONCMY|nr:Small inducible cytokine A4 precursor [Oncorhynchus mykiss]